jgi:hypothetical protein
MSCTGYSDDPSTGDARCTGCSPRPAVRVAFVQHPRANGAETKQKFGIRFGRSCRRRHPAPPLGAACRSCRLVLLRGLCLPSSAGVGHTAAQSGAARRIGEPAGGVKTSQAAIALGPFDRLKAPLQGLSGDFPGHLNISTRFAGGSIATVGKWRTCPTRGDDRHAPCGRRAKCKQFACAFRRARQNTNRGRRRATSPLSYVSSQLGELAANRKPRPIVLRNRCNRTGRSAGG